MVTKKEVLLMSVGQFWINMHFKLTKNYMIWKLTILNITTASVKGVLFLNNWKDEESRRLDIHNFLCLHCSSLSRGS